MDDSSVIGLLLRLGSDNSSGIFFGFPSNLKPYKKSLNCKVSRQPDNLFGWSKTRNEHLEQHLVGASARHQLEAILARFQPDSYQFPPTVSLKAQHPVAAVKDQVPGLPVWFSVGLRSLHLCFRFHFNQPKNQ
jgi:hypothetical protein